MRKIAEFFKNSNSQDLTEIEDTFEGDVRFFLDDFNKRLNNGILGFVRSEDDPNSVHIEICSFFDKKEDTKEMHLVRENGHYMFSDPDDNIPDVRLLQDLKTENLQQAIVSVLERLHEKYYPSQGMLSYETNDQNGLEAL